MSTTTTEFSTLSFWDFAKASIRDANKMYYEPITSFVQWVREVKAVWKHLVRLASIPVFEPKPQWGAYSPIFHYSGHGAPVSAFVHLDDLTDSEKINIAEFYKNVSANEPQFFESDESEEPSLLIGNKVITRKQIKQIGEEHTRRGEIASPTAAPEEGYGEIEKLFLDHEPGSIAKVFEELYEPQHGTHAFFDDWKRLLEEQLKQGWSRERRLELYVEYWKHKFEQAHDENTKLKTLFASFRKQVQNYLRDAVNRTTISVNEVDKRSIHIDLRAQPVGEVRHVTMKDLMKAAKKVRQRESAQSSAGEEGESAPQS